MSELCNKIKCHYMVFSDYSVCLYTFKTKLIWDYCKLVGSNYGHANK